MSPGLPQNTKNKVFSNYMNTLRVSGYDAQYRFTLMKGILMRIRECEDQIASGTRIRYRDKSQIMQMKAAKGGNYPNTWFLKGKTTGLLKVHPTPGGKLQGEIRGKLDQTPGPFGGNLKVVEKGGQLITTGLKRTQRFGATNEGCQFLMKCMIRGDRDCRNARGVYQIICKTCQDHPDNPKSVLYVGTSGFTMHKRLMEHQGAIRGNYLKNAMAKHQRKVHQQDAQVPVFEAEPIMSSIKFNLERFVMEALAIEKAKSKADILMNQKGEWGHYGITRLVVATDV